MRKIGIHEEKAHIHPCSVAIHIYPRLLNKILKRMKLWLHGQKALYPCSLIMHIYPCSLILNIYSCSVVIHIYPCSHLQLEQKGLLNKIYKKLEKIGIHEEKALIHPCSLIIHIYPCSHLELEQKRLLNKIYEN